jgi:class 3 adenylate cyclase/tetratricopeptide (TPR) repeat protein
LEEVAAVRAAAYALHVLACPNCGYENPDDASFCMACATSLTRATPAREVRKTVTVIFCDIVGSTSLGDRRDPELVRRVIYRYFDEMRRVVERHGGTVEKFIGDAVMAVFGVPHVHEDDALRAVRAAAEMLSALDFLNKELERDPGGITLEIRIGVNTGEVVAANPALQSLVLGDAVNVAAKLEQAAGPGEVLMGEDTHLLVRDAIVAEETAAVDIKGKADKVTAFRLQHVEPSTAGHIRRLDSPMVGRERPLRLVRQAFENAVADRACELVTILGPAGVGKSRLVEEFVRTVADASVYRGRCVPYGEGMTFFPVLDVVKQSTRLTDFDARDSIQAAVAELLEGEDQANAVTERIVELAAAGESVAPEETFWAVRRFLEALARRRPLVVVLDDLQWAEGTFLDLVEHVADWSRDSAILLLSMARPDLFETRPTWGGGKLRAITISLEPLSIEESDRLIANLLGATELDEAARTRIARAAGGNPLFVEEMLAKLIEEEMLVTEGGRWVPTGDLETIPIPSTISALLAARLDQLPLSERAVLERASIAGAEFLAGAVRHLSAEHERPSVDEQLHALVRKDVLRPDHSPVPGEDAYRFRHVLIRDAAYDGLPKEVRADLHESFAGWLEQLAGDRIVEQEEVLGYHLEQAHRYRSELGFRVDSGIAERAAAHLAAAGRRASTRVDFPAAANLLNRAVAVLPEDDPRQAGLLWELGTVLNRLGANARAREVLDRAADRAAAMDDDVLEARARIDGFFARMFMENVRADIREEVETLLPLLRERGDHLGLTKALQLIAFDRSWDGRFEAETALLDEALQEARLAGDRLEEAEILTSLMDSIWIGPTRVDDAIRRCDKIARDPRVDRRTDATVLGTRAILVAMLGRFDDARAMSAEAEAIQRDLGLEYAAFESAMRGFTVEWLAGDPVAAERELLRPERELPPEESLFRSARDALLVRAFCAQGRFPEARKLIERDEMPGELTWAVVLWKTGRAKILTSAGEHAEAERFARDAVEIAARVQSPNLHGDALMDLADVLARGDHAQEAVLVAAEARAVYERKGDVVSSRRAQAFIEGSRGPGSD